MTVLTELTCETLRGLSFRLRRLAHLSLAVWSSACVIGEPLTDADSLPPLWSEDFSGPEGRIQDYDPAWVHIFGQVNLDAASGAAMADPGPEDGDDDYAYRPQAASDLAIISEVYWDQQDGVGLQLVCPPGIVHESLYELAIYNDRLQLLRYDGGGDPTVYEVLETTRTLGLSSGEYRLTLRAKHDGTRWRLLGFLHRAGDERSLATVEALDDMHGPSIGQGIGIYNRSEEASRFFSLEVRGH